MHPTDDLDTTAVLELAREYAEAHDVESVVVASTTGATGATAADVFDPEVRDLVVVGHATGFDEPNSQELREDHVDAIEAAGGEVFFGPMAFSNVGGAIADRNGFAANTVVADVLRLFGQGTKVTLECVLMSADAGLVDVGTPVLAVAGTGDGADTVLLVHAANSRDFYDSRVLDVVAKPRDREHLVFW